MTTFHFPVGERAALALILFAMFLSQRNVAAAPEPLQVEGIENCFKLSENVYSGSSPETESAFAALQTLGIKTIITVDGAKPDVANARKIGLRYVHIPFGYGAIPEKQRLQLAKAAAELPKPIFIHCHHGMHRGPAAAAIICEATENWTAAVGVDWLKLAGTATNYSGLYKSVVEFRPLQREQLETIPSDFPDQVESSSLVEAMVQMDEHFDRLKKWAGREKSPALAHVDPAHEALLLEEMFKELNRSPELESLGVEFKEKMLSAEKVASEVRAATSDAKQFPGALEQLSNSCKACHKAYRN